MDPQQAADPQRPASGPTEPAVTNNRADEVADEVDVWWGAPSTRSMLPSFIVSVLITAIIAGGAWYLYLRRPGEVHWWRYGAYVLSLALWGQQIVQWSYRSVFVNYRLTTRRLWRDSGIRRPAGTVIELSHLKDVRVEPPTPRERLLGIGRLTVTANGNCPTTIVLYGLREPDRVAELIGATARRAAAVPEP
ncbi:MAG TPA: PH domain-containing protein [Gemmataceae bacterium]|nr:PH domain-containing protein [Gemmataceae bacterium]